MRVRAGSVPTVGNPLRLNASILHVITSTCHGSAIVGKRELPAKMAGDDDSDLHVTGTAVECIHQLPTVAAGRKRERIPSTILRRWSCVTGSGKGMGDPL